MRATQALILGLAVIIGLGAEPARDTGRFGIALDLQSYPQNKPQEALASILKALEAKRLDYLVAQLSDPEFMDARLKLFGGRLQDQVEDTQARLDPSTVKLLQRYLKDGEWSVADKEAMVLLKDHKEQQLYFQKSGDRWFMLHRSRPEKSKQPVLKPGDKE